MKKYYKVLLLFVVIFAMAGIITFAVPAMWLDRYIEDITLVNENDPYALYSIEVDSSIEYSVSFQAVSDTAEVGLIIDLYGGPDYDNAENDFSVALNGSVVKCNFKHYKDCKETVFIRFILTGNGVATVSNIRLYSSNGLSKGGIVFGIVCFVMAFVLFFIYKRYNHKITAIDLKTAKIVFIKRLRGIAVVSVMISHFDVFKSGTAHIVFSWLSPLNKNVYFNSGNVSQILNNLMIKMNFNPGPFGVSLFFVITGFTAMISLNRSEKMSMGSFAIKKILRLYPTYIGGFCISCIALICYILFCEPQIFPWMVKPMLMQILLVGRLFGFASLDGIVWTLECQLLFFILVFGLYKVGCLSRPTGIAVSSSALVLLHFILLQFSGSVFALVLSDMIIYIMFMLIGCGLYQFYQGNWRMEEALASSAFVLVLFCCLVGNSTLALNYAFGFIVFCIFMFAEQGGHLSIGVISDFFSEISFSLYASHPIVMYTVLSFLDKHGIHSTAASLVTFTINVVVAIFVYYAVERPFGKIISYIGKRQPA